LFLQSSVTASEKNYTAPQGRFFSSLIANLSANRVLDELLTTHLMSTNLTKRDMVVSISKEVGITQQQAFAVIQKTLDQITASLAQGNNVELRNFGVFEVRLTKPRLGRNPNKPEIDVTIPARAIVKFTAGKVMREKVLRRTELMLD